MEEIELRQIMAQRGLAVVGDEITAEEKTAAMLETLYIIIPPKSVLDRITLHRVVQFYSQMAKSQGQQPDSVFKILIDFALEASGPFSRVPAAVFMSILKKEFDYSGKSNPKKS